MLQTGEQVSASHLQQYYHKTPFILAVQICVSGKILAQDESGAAEADGHITIIEMFENLLRASKN